MLGGGRLGQFGMIMMNTEHVAHFVGADIFEFERPKTFSEPFSASCLSKRWSRNARHFQLPSRKLGFLGAKPGESREDFWRPSKPSDLLLHRGRDKWHFRAWTRGHNSTTPSYNVKLERESGPGPLKATRSCVRIARGFKKSSNLAHCGNFPSVASNLIRQVFPVQFRYTSLMRVMRIAFVVVMAVAWCGPVSLGAFGDEGALNPAEPKGVTSDEIIQHFAAKEKEFKTALDQYGYRQTVKVQTVDGDTPDGEYQQVFDVSFDDQGKKVKNVVFAPQSTLQRIMMTEQDIDDIENRLPFVLTSDEIGEYSILYVGQQQEDDLHCYVFDIAPKKIEGKKRYFQGRIWVDDKDFQIVKTYGKSVPDITRKKGNENLFPKFTTYREQVVDGPYWFPVYTRADDTLHFSTGDVKIREIVKYTNYKKFGSNVKITYDGKDVEKGDPSKNTPPQQPQK